MGPNLSKPMGHMDSDRSSSTSYTTAKPSTTSRTTKRKAPHITITPWDGSPLTRQTFINHLRAYVYFNSHRFPSSAFSSPADVAYDRMIFALSYLCGDAADVAGEYLTKLIEQKALLEKEKNTGKGMDVKEWEGYEGWAPMGSEVFLESYTKTVARKVAEKRKEEGRRRNNWPQREMRLLWRALVWLGRWMTLVAILFTVLTCLAAEVKGLVKRNGDIVWMKGDGVVPNRGRFVGRNKVELL